MTRRHLRRALWKALLPLLLGVVTTVSIAWYLADRVIFAGGCPGWYGFDTSFPGGTWEVERREPLPWPGTSGNLPAPDHFPPVLRIRVGWMGMQTRSEVNHVAFDTLAYPILPALRLQQQQWQASLPRGVPDLQDFRFPEYLWDARGWPLPAMTCRWEFADGDLTKAPVLHDGIALPSDPKTPTDGFTKRALPLRPYWRGFTVDAILFTAGWSILLFALPASRQTTRWYRAARGRCPKCGYDQRGLLPGTPCPECGG